MSDNTAPRNLEEAKLDARYAAIFQGLNARFFRRVGYLFDFISLASGTVAFTLVFGSGTYGAVAGGLVALVTIVDRILKPSEKAILHGECEGRFLTLLSRTDLETLEKFDSEYFKTLECGRDGLTGLKHLAYNQNVVAAGYESFSIALSRWERSIARLV